MFLQAGLTTVVLAYIRNFRVTRLTYISSIHAGRTGMHKTVQYSRKFKELDS